MLNFETGDVLSAVESGVVLAHVCNNKGGWGKGFTGIRIMTEDFGGWCCDVRCYLRNAYNYKVNNSITLRVLYLAGYGSYQAAEKIWEAVIGDKLANGN